MTDKETSTLQSYVDSVSCQRDALTDPLFGDSDAARGSRGHTRFTWPLSHSTKIALRIARLASARRGDFLLLHSAQDVRLPIH